MIIFLYEEIFNNIPFPFLLFQTLTLLIFKLIGMLCFCLQKPFSSFSLVPHVFFIFPAIAGLGPELSE